MKTAGDILSALFDEGFVKKAQGYSKFFDSWTDITAKNGIAAAAGHSHIKDLDRGIVLVEMDHPGWKQIIQTKQSKLLNDFRRRFPELDISGISLMLGSASAPGGRQGESQSAASAETTGMPVAQTAQTYEPPQEQLAAAEFASHGEPAIVGYGAVKDEDFREKLIKLGQTIADREQTSK
jgi:hypothetical protein